MVTEDYGMELILDLHECDTGRFNREYLRRYFRELCDDILNMERCKLYFWDDLGVPEHLRQTNPKTKGTSAVQFVLTSNITVHTLDDLGQVYINIFSCKTFNEVEAKNYSESFFRGYAKQARKIVRL